MKYLVLGIGLAVILGVGYWWFIPRSVKKSPITVQPSAQGVAYFAGGCFWCTESDFEKLPGVLEVTSGYIGGSAETATYKQTSSGGTGHRESVKVLYDTNQLRYQDLVGYHWRHFDPTDNDGQFYDRGFQYSPAVYYQTAAEKQAAESSLAQLNQSGVFKEPIVVPILEASPFYPAEEYHQDYYLKNPARYQFYRQGSGRDAFLESVWGQKK